MTRRVVRGCQRGDGVRTGTREALQRAQAAVAALGLQRQLHVVLGEVCEGAVTQQMQRPAGLRDEQLGGTTVGLPEPKNSQPMSPP